VQGDSLTNGEKERTSRKGRGRGMQHGIQKRDKRLSKQTSGTVSIKTRSGQVDCDVR